MRPHLLDVNVWLALILSAHRHHDVAREWVDGITTAGSVVLDRATQVAVLRLLTNAAVLGAYGNEPLTNAAAWEVIDDIMADDRVVLHTQEGDSFTRHLRAFSDRPTASPKLWMDAHLAARAAAEGFVLVTLDAAFEQFPGIDVIVLSTDDVT